MKIAKFIIILLFAVCELSAQGFNWQPSVRSPHKIKTVFLGVGYGYSFSKTSSEIFLHEDNVFSCILNAGNAHSSDISITSDIWFASGLDALSLALTYSDNSSNLAGFPYPVFYKNDTLLTKVSNDNSLKYISLSGLYKYRVLSSHFSVSLGGNLGFKLSSKTNYLEEVISPGDSYNDGTTSRVMTPNEVAFSPFLISPQLRIGYDFPLFNDTYASVHSDFSFNANSIVKGNHWRNFNFSIGISIFRGIH